MHLLGLIGDESSCCARASKGWKWLWKHLLRHGGER